MFFENNTGLCLYLVMVFLIREGQMADSALKRRTTNSHNEGGNHFNLQLITIQYKIALQCHAVTYPFLATLNRAILFCLWENVCRKRTFSQRCIIHISATLGPVQTSNFSCTQPNAFNCVHKKIDPSIMIEWPTQEFRLWSVFVSNVKLLMCRT